MKVPTTYDLKPAFQRMLKPGLQWLHNAGVTPNALTWTAIFLSGGLGYSFVLGQSNRYWFFAVAGGLLVRMALNALDGMMARNFKMTSKGGAVLNELGDVVSDVLVMWPLALVPGVHVGWVAALLWLAAVNEYAGVLGASVSGERRYEGPMGKSDRTLVWGVFCLLLGAGFTVEPYTMYGVYAVLIGLLWSTARRVSNTLTSTP
ncbi:MAG: CDP-alcohol phosphatidyltransferase [Flavobacteriales bacterium]|jgi:CDP-diacylglycerol--glycerol-3-phosphate 3-phosphatidyltransferase|nr:CDP-alcohol phosphatidyltransferase [Flavobacteriales bacterium]